jgi:uncharacterized protein (DUF2141 family)
MFKLSQFLAAASLLVGAGGAAAAMPQGAEAGACAADAGPAALVHVQGFKARTGSLRVAVYGSNPADFLAKGKYLKRIDLAVPRSGPAELCIALPHAGDYAIAVRHDLNGSGSSDWNDGGGFSRNPKLSLFNYKPRFDAVAVAIGARPREVPVVLNYRQGLSIGPVRN